MKRSAALLAAVSVIAILTPFVVHNVFAVTSGAPRPIVLNDEPVGDSSPPTTAITGARVVIVNVPAAGAVDTLKPHAGSDDSDPEDRDPGDGDDDTETDTGDGDDDNSDDDTETDTGDGDDDTETDTGDGDDDTETDTGDGDDDNSDDDTETDSGDGDDDG